MSVLSFLFLTVGIFCIKIFFFLIFIQCKRSTSSLIVQFLILLTIALYTMVNLHGVEVHMLELFIFFVTRKFFYLTHPRYQASTLLLVLGKFWW